MLKEYNEEIYCLTMYGCLLKTCEEYEVNISHLTSKIGEHFVEDLLELLVLQGYIGVKDSD